MLELDKKRALNKARNKVKVDKGYVEELNGV
jgi:hypothetical protein